MQSCQKIILYLITFLRGGGITDFVFFVNFVVKKSHQLQGCGKSTLVARFSVRAGLAAARLPAFAADPCMVMPDSLDSAHRRHFVIFYELLD
jgi:hypothetical protein